MTFIDSVIILLSCNGTRCPAAKFRVYALSRNESHTPEEIDVGFPNSHCYDGYIRLRDTIYSMAGIFTLLVGL